jgi:3,4-dihydroxy 2-butanone 4-phosphate synthase / GTP cyclohydrolase II
MKLTAWLEKNKVKRADFARAIGVSPGAVTQFCNQDRPWISRETATLIFKETKGAVTPNDFLGLAPGNGLNGKDNAVADSVSSAIAAFKAGEIVVVSDDEDREGEGDLFIAASLATPQAMAFVVRHTSGIVCAPLPAEEARRLRLDPMVSTNDAPLGTAFTVSVDVRWGLTTGISAEERTNTVRALANGNMGASDFVRPGHVFPLIARDGGVLMRSGHTEACVDLCRLAGLPPVGVLAELVNDDGTVMKGRQVAEFAKRHRLKLLTVADLIAYRQSREKLVERVASFAVETAIGSLQGHAFVTPFDAVNHFAFVHGDLGDGRDVLTRLHRAHILQDVFGGGKAINASLARFKEAGRGVLIYLRDGTSGVPVAKLPDGERSGSEAERTRQWREIGLGAQILRDLGVSSIRLLSSHELTYVGLSGFGIEIVKTEAVDG